MSFEYSSILAKENDGASSLDYLVAFTIACITHDLSNFSSSSHLLVLLKTRMESFLITDIPFFYWLVFLISVSSSLVVSYHGILSILNASIVLASSNALLALEYSD